MSVLSVKSAFRLVVVIFSLIELIASKPVCEPGHRFDEFIQQCVLERPSGHSVDASTTAQAAAPTVGPASQSSVYTEASPLPNSTRSTSDKPDSGFSFGQSEWLFVIPLVTVTLLVIIVGVLAWSILSGQLVCKDAVRRCFRRLANVERDAEDGGIGGDGVGEGEGIGEDEVYGDGVGEGEGVSQGDGDGDIVEDDEGRLLALRGPLPPVPSPESIPLHAGTGEAVAVILEARGGLADTTYTALSTL